MIPIPKDNLKIAIIITCYNYEDYIVQAISSVKSQMTSDCELIVIDDGSTDGSWKKIEESGVTSYRIENCGQRLACVAGLDRSTAPFVLFLDADDMLEEGALKTIIQQLDQDVAKLQFSLKRIDSGGRTIGGPTPDLKNYRDKEVLRKRITRSGVYKTPPTSGNVFRRDVCELLRDAHYDRSVDGIILFAAPFFGDVVSISKSLGIYRIHDRNVSRMGQIPEPITMEADIRRLTDRMNHLRQILRGRFAINKVFEIDKVYALQERKFCFLIASGTKPKLRFIPRLIIGAFKTEMHLKHKIAMSTFFILGTLLPQKKASLMLAYRFSIRQRTFFGLIRKLISVG